VHSGDCSGLKTGITKFRGWSENLAGKFHWNGTGIHRNDRNPAGICRASLSPLWFLEEAFKMEAGMNGAKLADLRLIHIITSIIALQM
jgi:hypothetical protein